MTAEANHRFTWGDMAAAAIAGVTAFVAYVATLSPTVTGEDSGEFISAAYTLGIPHPPGYPLWCLAAHAFTRLPFGEVAWQVNLSSAFFAAATVGLVALFIIGLTRHRLAAVAGALALAFSREFWEQAIIAEVYALNAFLLIVCLLLLWRWQGTHRRGLLYALALVVGLGQANHNTMAIAAVVFAVFILWFDEEPWRARLRCYALGVVIAVVAAVTVYAYLPLASLRNPPMDWGNPETLQGWIDHVRRKQLDFMFSQYPRSVGRFAGQLVVYGQFWLREFTPWVGVIGLAGLAVCFVRNRAWAIFTLTLGVVTVATFSFVQNFEFDAEWLWIMSVFGIPLYMTTAVWMGYALAALRATWAVALVGLVCAVSPFAANWHHNNRAGDYWVHDYATNVLTQLEPDAILFSPRDHLSFSAVYMQSVEGFRTDVLVGRRYGYLAPEVIALIPPEYRDPAWGDKPPKRYDPAIFTALLQHTQRPVYFSEPPKLAADSGVTFVQEGLIYRAVRAGDFWRPDLDIWQHYTWHTLDCADGRGDNTARIIVAEVAFAHAMESFRAANPGEAAGHLEQGIACYGEDVRLLNNAGTMCARFGYYEPAEQFFLRAVEAYPGHEAATANLERVRRLREGGHP